MKQPPPTLMDSFYQASFRPETVPGWTDNKKWRTALSTARRFVLSDAMSTFLGELATVAFARPHLSKENVARMADHLRIGARLPHEVTWIEYNLRDSLIASHALLGSAFNPADAPEREGWLLQQHPNIPTAFRAHILTQDVRNKDMHGFDSWTFPVAYAWTCDMETVLPWRPIPFDPTSAEASAIATGVPAYKSDRASIIFSDMIETPNNGKAVSGLIEDWSGVLRRIWALLATINDLPVLRTEVRPQRGFAARGTFRHYLSHRTITLTVPQKLYRKVARTALAIAHRRAHEVRGHWRKDWRHPLSPLCDHDFTADEKHMTCGICNGRKSWVTQHTRGDDRRGFTLHDYVVKHDD